MASSLASLSRSRGTPPFCIMSALRWNLKTPQINTAFMGTRYIVAARGRLNNEHMLYMVREMEKAREVFQLMTRIFIPSRKPFCGVEDLGIFQYSWAISARISSSTSEASGLLMSICEVAAVVPVNQGCSEPAKGVASPRVAWAMQ